MQGGTSHGSFSLYWNTIYMELRGELECLKDYWPTPSSKLRGTEYLMYKTI